MVDFPRDDDGMKRIFKNFSTFTFDSANLLQGNYDIFVVLLDMYITKLFFCETKILGLY